MGSSSLLPYTFTWMIQSFLAGAVVGFEVAERVLDAGEHVGDPGTLEIDFFVVAVGFIEDASIAGLSMGGGQSLSIGFHHPELFSAVGAFSAAVPEKLDAHFAGLAKNKLKVLWFACGVDDSLLQRSKDLDALLTKQNIPHTFRETAGAHTYTVWRQYLSEFAPLLFRD